MATPRPMSTAAGCICQAVLMVQMALTRMRPLSTTSPNNGNKCPVSHLRALTLPEQRFAWTGELAHAHPALARQLVGRIPHESKMRLIARAGLS